MAIVIALHILARDFRSTPRAFLVDVGSERVDIVGAEDLTCNRENWTSPAYARTCAYTCCRASHLSFAYCDWRTWISADIVIPRRSRALAYSRNE